MVLAVDIRHWPVDEPPPWAGVWVDSCARYDLQDRANATYIKDFYCIHMVTRGRVRLRAGPHADALLGYGDMFAIWPGTPYAYFPEGRGSRDGAEIVWLRVKGRLVREYMGALGFGPHKLSLRARAPRRVEEIMDDILELAASPKADADARAVALLHLLAPACRYVREPRPSGETLAERARRFMEQHVEHGVNVEQVARAFHVSRSTLFLHFRRSLGKSPVEVLVETRIDRARRLLEETDLPVGEIAAACGYADPLYLTRQFHAVVGSAPTAFRARLRAEAE